MPPSNGQVNSWSKEDLDKEASEKLGENEKCLKEDIAALKAWISKNPHLHNNIRTDEAYLTMFLRGCKFSLEKTKAKIDLHHSIKSALPECYDNWNPFEEKAQDLLKAGAFLPLRGYDKKGRFVLLIRIGAINPAKITFGDVMRISSMVTSVATKDDAQSEICGLAMISDHEGSTLQHAGMFMSLPMLKKSMANMEGHPFRPKAMHLLNILPVMKTVIDIWNGMQKDKMKERTHVHDRGDNSKLHVDLGKDILPKEYGGTNGTVQELTDYWKTEVESSNDWLQEQTKFKTDEALRPGKPKLHADIFGGGGIEGSFRKLDFD